GSSGGASEAGEAPAHGGRSARAYTQAQMIEELVEQIEARFAELGEQMTDPLVIGDRERYAEVGRAYRQLAPAAQLATQWRRVQDDAAGAEALLSEEGEDAELRQELVSARERIAELEEEIRLAMVERDPNDQKSVLVEIQGAAGGGGGRRADRPCRSADRRVPLFGPRRAVRQHDGLRCARHTQAVRDGGLDAG